MTNSIGLLAWNIWMVICWMLRKMYRLWMTMRRIYWNFVMFFRNFKKFFRQVFRLFSPFVLCFLLLIPAFLPVHASGSGDIGTPVINAFDYMYSQRWNYYDTPGFGSVYHAEFVDGFFPGSYLDISFISSQNLQLSPRYRADFAGDWVSLGYNQVTLDTPPHDVPMYCYRIFGNVGLSQLEQPYDLPYIDISFGASIDTSKWECVGFSFSGWGTNKALTASGKISMAYAEHPFTDAYNASLPYNTDPSGKHFSFSGSIDMTIGQYDVASNDIIQIVAYLDGSSLNNISVYSGNDSIPFSLSRATGLTYPGGSGSGSAFFTITVDLRGVTRSKALFVGIDVAFDDASPAEIGFIRISGYRIASPPNPVVAVARFLLNTVNFKSDVIISKLDDLVQNAIPDPVDPAVSDGMAQAGSDLSDLGTQLGDVSQPDLASVNTDMGTLTGGGFASAAKFFQHSLSKPSVLQFVILTMTFAVVGYLFYGKK